MVQLLLWTERDWDRYYCGQSESGTGIAVKRMRVGQVVLWKK